MMGASYDETMAAGRLALREGRWPDARESFEAAVTLDATPEALEGLADAQRWAHDPATIETQERAYELYRRRADKLSAARMATYLGTDNIEFRGDPPVARAWLQRARRLLEGLTDTSEYGWWLLWDGHTALFTQNDTEHAAARASEAAEVARKLDLIDLEAVALALEGLALVSSGEVEGGMRRLDEGAAPVVAGEMQDANAMATTMCYLMDACDRIRDYDRAARWCARAAEIARMIHFEELMGLCRPHYAVVLMWRGDWQEAEQQLLVANEMVMTARPPMIVEGLVRLGELRWRQGRWDEAAALFEQVRGAELSQLGRAELLLGKGETQEAIDLVQRYLRRIPPHDRLERAFGLEVMVRALVAAGRADDARPHAEELRAIAEHVRTDPMRAAASLAEGVIAAAHGEHDAARMHLEDAADYYDRHGAPFESARARLELARSLDQLGRRQAAAREAQEALATLSRMGAAKEAERALRLLRSISPDVAKGLAAQDEAGLSRRELEVLRLIAAGRSNQEIAETLVLSVRTVERHISTIYEKIGASGKAARAAATAYAMKHGVS